jgi:general secretion pathway protein A
MDTQYRTFFGLRKEPFGQDLQLDEILQTSELLGVKQRFDYTLRIGAMGLLTGEIGSGKSTALRYAIGKLHPSEYSTLYVTASSGSILELYRLILAELGIDTSSPSKAALVKRIRREIQEIVVGKKMKALLIIDEASLLRLDVFGELHTICQFQQDSKPYLPLILAGQNNLVDKLLYRDSQKPSGRH